MVEEMEQLVRDYGTVLRSVALEFIEELRSSESNEISVDEEKEIIEFLTWLSELLMGLYDHPIRGHIGPENVFNVLKNFLPMVNEQDE